MLHSIITTREICIILVLFLSYLKINTMQTGCAPNNALLFALGALADNVSASTSLVY